MEANLHESPLQSGERVHPSMAGGAKQTPVVDAPAAQHPTAPSPRVEVASLLLIGGIAFLIGTYQIGDTGPLWPDAPRYANGAAMMHDWFRSGEWAHPYRFAQQNYAQYPGFSIPYHPPGYPLLLGLVFLVTGVSYEAARVFIGTCLAAAGILFYHLARRLGAAPLVALAAALLLITTPEIARWARDTMSELPSLVFLLAAASIFLRWLDSGQSRYCWLAFALAGWAFMCRVTAVGAVPGLVVYAVLMGRGRQLLRPSFAAAAGLFLALVVAWTLFATQFCRYETAADGRGQMRWIQNLAYFAECLPMTLTWGSGVLGVAGLASALVLRTRSRIGTFWLCWLGGYAAFKLAVPTSVELRHFLLALPALAGLAACLPEACAGFGATRLRWAVPVLIALVLNGLSMLQFPRGVVGYDAVGACLAAQPEAGNVLLTCWEDQELIFRYRAADPMAQRQLIRGDRTLCIRLPDYARVPTQQIAESGQDVEAILRAGRIRYLVTCVSDGRRDDRTEEMVLAHQLVTSAPDRFTLIGRFPLRVDFGNYSNSRRGQAFVWVARGPLPEGNSELPVTIPTAALELSSPR